MGGSRGGWFVQGCGGEAFLGDCFGQIGGAPCCFGWVTVGEVPWRHACCSGNLTPWKWWHVTRRAREISPALVL